MKIGLFVLAIGCLVLVFLTLYRPYRSDSSVETVTAKPTQTCDIECRLEKSVWVEVPVTHLETK